MQIWNADGSGQPFIYEGHTYYAWVVSVASVAWSPDGTRIASGSSDRVVQVWNADGSGEAFIYKGHSDEVLSVAWFPDGTRIASTSRDKSVQVWSAG